MSRARAVLVFAAMVAALGASPSLASAGTHPHFDDRGTLVWYRSLPEAEAAARASGKLVFIESGRLECGSCRKLVERILPQEPIRSRLSAIAVGLADDCDVTGSPAGLLLNRNLPHATFLPLVGFATADGRWVTGWFGSSTPAQVLAHLEIAERACASLQAQGAGPDAPAPAVAAPRATVPFAPRVPAAVVPHAVVPVAPRVPAAVAPRVAVPVAPRPEPQAATLPRAPTAPRATPPVAPTAPLPTPLAILPRPTPPSCASPTVPPSLPSIARAPAPVPHASGSATGDDPLARARAAAESGDWGTVLRVWEEIGNSRNPSALADLSPYAERAHLWCLGQVDDAERAAKDRRYDDAMRSLALVRRSLDGTTCPIAVDAERGERAIERLMAIEQGSPDQADAPETLRRRAYQEFRGSRWAPLFRSRS